MQPTPQDLAKLTKLAQSPAGQALMALLQQGGADWTDAQAQAAAGNYTQAQATLKAVLSTPEAQALLRQLEAQL